MLTRRRFLSVAAAGATTLSRFGRLPDLAAADFDLLIKGGRVMDPSRRFDEKSCDVAFRAGKIAAVQPNISASSAAQVVDAGGKLDAAIFGWTDRKSTPLNSS